MLDLIKVIPWIQEYPVWLQAFVCVWVSITALLIVSLIFTPRKAPGIPSSRIAEEGNVPKPDPIPKIIEQVTTGDNSPAVAGVEGNVTITTEQQKNAK